MKNTINLTECENCELIKVYRELIISVKRNLNTCTELLDNYDLSLPIDKKQLIIQVNTSLKHVTQILDKVKTYGITD